EPAAAPTDHRTRLARPAEGPETALAGQGTRKRGNLVDGVGEDVQSRRGSPVVGDLEGVGPFPGPAGLEDHQIGGVRADRLGAAAPSSGNGKQRIEQPDRDWSPVVDPTIINA